MSEGTAAERLDALLRKTAILAGYASDRKARGERAAAAAAAAAASSSSSSSSSSSKKEAAPPGSPSRARRMLSEAEEDERLVKEEAEEEDGAPSYLTVQPSLIKGKMRPYQLEALNWMIGLHDRGLNGILADEMGLGKTLESISMLGYLAQYRGVRGPHIVIVPKSTSSNWVREFGRWCPSLSVFKFHGSKEERAEQRARVGTTDVLITTYEVAIIEKSTLSKVQWEYLYIDEAHRIKNENSLLSQIVRTFSCKHRVLVTGTPLQNNLHELWALLNFLLPDVFDSAVDFESWFQIGPGGDDDKSDRDAVVSKLHRILRPFLLRRLKSDVEKSLLPKVETNLYVGLSDMQREWYTRILKKDIDALNTSAKRSGAGKSRLLNIVMQLRKVCNHPYLFDGAEPGPPYVEGEHLVTNSGKMILLDKLLRRLRERGSRVLIFSQMTRLLDVLEDYCRYRGFEYCRIDGSTHQDDRDEAMDAYNAPGSSKFVFLLSTRAGGLGINLQTADTVVLYDSDWNPQMDLQAQDRAHRIGQKKQVHVYRFVSENTMEEKIVQRAYEKLFLDAMVIQQGRLMDDAKKKKLSPDELQAMVRFGANQIFQAKGATVTDDDIEAILARGAERTKVLNDNLKRNVDTDLLTFKSDGGSAASVYQYEGKDFRSENAAAAAAAAAFGDSEGFIDLGQRERKGQTFNVNQYFREALRVGDAKPAGPREFRPPVRPDYQFFQNDRLEALERKQWEARERFRALVREDRERRQAERHAEREAKRIERRRQRAAERKAAGGGSGDEEGDDQEEEEEEDDDDDEGEEEGDEREEEERNGDASNGVEDGDDGDKDMATSAGGSRPGDKRGADGDADGGAPGKRQKTGGQAPMSPRSARREEEQRRREELRAQAGFPSAKEEAERERLLAEGFGSWQRRHLLALVRAMEQHGRKAKARVFSSVEGKTPAEVEEYYNVFWARHDELKNGEKLVAQIERGEERIQREAKKRAVIAAKVRKYDDPYNTLEVPYSAGHKGRSYNEDEDRFIVCALDEIGWGAWDELKRRVRGAWQFRFDWYFKSRTAGDLAQRANFLFRLLEKEAEREAAAKKGSKGKGKKPAAKKTKK